MTRGFTLVELLLAVAIGAVLAAIGVPGLIQARKHENEYSAIRSLRTIGTSEAIFRDGDKENDGNLDYGMLSELARTDLVDPVLGSGTKGGYVFQATYSFTTSEFLWFAVASPAIPVFTGDRYFSTNEAGMTWYSTGAPARLDTDTCLLPSNGLVPCGGK